MRFLLLTIILTMTFISCDPKNNFIEATGTLEKQGITSYQYGTHILINTDQRYALRSKSIELDSFVNRKVLLQAKKVDGYPLEGGPVLLEVVDIENQ